jgi:tetratricopeptide (TPR) repeat protein
LAERDWNDALKIVDHFRKTDKETAAYFAALVFLRQGRAARAAAEVEVLRLAFQKRKDDPRLEYRVWETQGLLLCQMGGSDCGLKLLAKAADRSKTDWGHHSWGNGAYFMEAWGTAALQANRLDVAEEAFLEALAHDPGSVQGALGLRVLCERQGRTAEAERYAQLAQRCWNHARPDDLAAVLDSLRSDPSAQRAERTVDNGKAAIP